jgi:hypothetical protein
MAKTGAERQAAYRARQAIEESGQRRISTWISREAALALEVLAHRYGVTMRGVIEMLVLRDHEMPGNQPINKDFSPLNRPSKKRTLPSNEPFPIASIGALPVEALLRNEVAPASSGDHGSLLHNEGRPRISPAAEVAPEPPRGGQYSLEL